MNYIPLPINSIICKYDTTGELLAGDDFKKVLVNKYLFEVLPVEVRNSQDANIIKDYMPIEFYNDIITKKEMDILRITTNQNDILYLPANWRINIYNEETDIKEKYVKELKPSDKLFKFINCENFGEGIGNFVIPELLGMTLISKLNNISLFSALKNYRDRFKQLIEDVEPLIKDLITDNNMTDKVNAFHRYCRVRSHGMADIVNKFNQYELLTYISTLLQVYAVDDYDNKVLVIDHDLTSAEYINNLLHKVGICKSYVKTIDTQHGPIYEIVIKDDSLQLLLNNIHEYAKMLNECPKGPILVNVKNIVTCDPVNIVYRVKYENNDDIIVNSILINKGTSKVG